MVRYPRRWGRGVHASIHENAIAYGYSILITTVFGSLNLLEGSPRLGDIFLFVIGASVGFATLEAMASRMFRRKLEGETQRVVILGGALGIFSIVFGLGGAVGVAWLLPGGFAWGLSPAVATIVYIVVSGLQMSVAERAEESQIAPRGKGGGSKPGRKRSRRRK